MNFFKSPESSAPVSKLEGESKSFESFENIGTIELKPKTVDDYRVRFAAEGINTDSTYVDEMIDTLQPVNESLQLELYVVNVYDFDVSMETSLEEMYKKAKESGLDLCPPQIALEMMINPLDLGNHVELRVAMNPIEIDGTKRSFVVYNFDSDHGKRKELSTDFGSLVMPLKHQSLVFCVKK